MLSHGLAHFSALGVSDVMRSINVRYLLTYLLTYLLGFIASSHKVKYEWRSCYVE